MTKTIIKLLPLIMGLCYTPFTQGMDSNKKEFSGVAELKQQHLPFTLLDLQDIDGMYKKFLGNVPPSLPNKCTTYPFSKICSALFEDHPGSKETLLRILGLDSVIDVWEKDQTNGRRYSEAVNRIFEDVTQALSAKLTQAMASSISCNFLPEAFVQIMANFSQEDGQNTLVQRAIDLTGSNLNQPENKILSDALGKLQEITFGNIFNAQGLLFFLNHSLGPEIQKEKAEFEHNKMCAAVEAAKLEQIRQARVLLPSNEESKEESKSDYNSPVHTPKNDRQDQKGVEEPDGKKASKLDNIPLDVSYIYVRDPKDSAEPQENEDGFLVVE